MKLLEALVLLTVLIGLAGLLLRRNLLLKVLAMDVMSTGVIALFVLLAARGGVGTPILRGGALEASQEVAPHTNWADPIPQAVILTGIVIGFSVQALLLVATARLARIDPCLDVAVLEAETAKPAPHR